MSFAGRFMQERQRYDSRKAVHTLFNIDTDYTMTTTDLAERLRNTAERLDTLRQTTAGELVEVD